MRKDIHQTIREFGLCLLVYSARKIGKSATSLHLSTELASHATCLEIARP